MPFPVYNIRVRWNASPDATGSAFSLVPIDNATGNFVKVEQRVTVRIKLDKNDDVAKLKSGYNVECCVKE